MVSSSQLAAIQERYVVSNAVRRSDGVFLRVVTDVPPGANARPLPPSLEDAYLHRIAAGQQGYKP